MSESNLDSGGTWSESHHDEESLENTSNANPSVAVIDLDDAFCVAPELESTENEGNGSAHGEITGMKRTQSLDDIVSRAAAAASSSKPYMYSFRMPLPYADTNNTTTRNRQTMSDGNASITDYNFVLDNYIEYADDTAIPRLRGKDDNNRLLAAIHSSHWSILCTVVTASCFLTYSLSNHAPFLRADMSQAIVITMVLATFPEVAASSGAGAFAGMAIRSDAIPNYGWLTLLAFVTSVNWILFYRYKILVGCGGRLGTCAFVSMNVVALIAMLAGAVPWSSYGDKNALWAERLEMVPSVLSVLASSILSALSGAVRLKSGIPLNPVQAPTTLALLCMLVLEPTEVRYIKEIDAGLAVGSFVAMASTQYLPTIFDFAFSGFIAGLYILLLEPFFIGFGGKKGFTSFCGFATYVLVTRTLCRRRDEEKEK